MKQLNIFVTSKHELTHEAEAAGPAAQNYALSFKHCIKAPQCSMTVSMLRLGQTYCEYSHEPQVL